MNARKIFIGIGLALGVGELLDSIAIARQPDGFPAGVIIVGLAFLAVSLWATRGGRASAITLGLLCLFEFVSLIGTWASKHNPSLSLTLSLLAFLVVSLLGLVACTATLIPRRHPTTS
jgi:hypothetical protein